MRRSLLAVFVLPFLVYAAEFPSDYEEYSPEWFYGLSFVDARAAVARRGMERFFQRDWNGAAGLAVGSGVRVADQALAQASVEFARGADFAVDGLEDSARASFLRCAEKSAQAVVLAEDVPQVLRSTVLKARCLAVVPDRAAAATKGAFASQALHSQGLMLAEAGRFQEIFPLCQEAERLFPSDQRMRAKMRILEGRAWLGVGDTARALFRWKTMTNAFVKGVGDLLPDSVEAAEVYWRLGDLSARHAAQVRFDAPDAEGRKAAHAARRDLMEESFGYFRQAVACYAYPWTPVALRDIAGVIERYALDVAGQRIDFRNDTDRVAQEILVQRKLPTLFQSAGNTYRRQIRLARTSGDGIGIGLQSGRGLARSWWCAVQARRTAADLLRTSPRPPGDSTGLAWYGHVVDSAVAAELSTGRRTAAEGLADLAQWGQLGWGESDSLKAFLGPQAAQAAVAKGQEKNAGQAQGLPAQDAQVLTVVQWNWRGLEARRQSRNMALDIRLLRARLSGF